ncbi:MAG: hypothetical protein ACTSRZ_17150 [Promethearchaeota archaeon]
MSIIVAKKIKDINTPFLSGPKNIRSIYMPNLDNISDSLILDVNVDEDYGEDLCTCLNTFKKHYKVILRFRKFFIMDNNIATLNSKY